MIPGQFGPISRTALPPARVAGREVQQVGLDPDHVVDGNPFGDADDELHAGVGRLENRVRGEWRRDEDHRSVRARLADGVGNRVENRNALVDRSALPGRHSGDDLRAVFAAGEGMEAPFPPRQPLDEQARLFSGPDRHYAAALTA